MRFLQATAEAAAAPLAWEEAVPHEVDTEALSVRDLAARSHVQGFAFGEGEARVEARWSSRSSRSRARFIG